MKTYLITLKTGDSFTMDADDDEHLRKKLGTGHYGVLPIRAKTRILATPDTIEKIEEVEDEESQID